MTGRLIIDLSIAGNARGEVQKCLDEIEDEVTVRRSRVPKNVPEYLPGNTTDYFARIYKCQLEYLPDVVNAVFLNKCNAVAARLEKISTLPEGIFLTLGFHVFDATDNYYVPIPKSLIQEVSRTDTQLYFENLSTQSE